MWAEYLFWCCLLFCSEESHIDEKTQELKSKDEVVAQKDKAIRDKSDRIASLQKELSALQVCTKAKMDDIYNVLVGEWLHTYAVKRGNHSPRAFVTKQAFFFLILRKKRHQMLQSRWTRLMLVLVNLKSRWATYNWNACFGNHCFFLSIACLCRLRISRRNQRNNRGRKRPWKPGRLKLRRK